MLQERGGDTEVMMPQHNNCALMPSSPGIYAVHCSSVRWGRSAALSLHPSRGCIIAYREMRNRADAKEYSYLGGAPAWPMIGLTAHKDTYSSSH